jgi:hypothetical protein
VNGFIDHLYTPLGTTSNYGGIADFHTSQITSKPAAQITTTPAAKPFPACDGFISHFLATAANSGYFSTSCFQVF